MDSEVFSFSSLPPLLQARILNEVQPADPQAWASRPMPSLGGRSFLDAYRDGDVDAIERYFVQVGALLQPRSVHDSPGNTAAADGPPDGDVGDRPLATPGLPLLVRPSFRSIAAALWAVGRVPLMLLVIAGLAGIHGETMRSRVLRMALVFSLATVLSACYTLGARIEARSDGTLVRRLSVTGLWRRYPRGSIERVRMSDADITNPRWSASASFVGSAGQQRFRLYLTYWSPHDIGVLATNLGYELFDDRTGSLPGAVTAHAPLQRAEQRWRPGQAVLVAIAATGAIAAAILIIAGAGR